MSDATAQALVALSQWIDAGNAHRDPEAVTWGRLAKLTEEAGEVIAAYIGATGQNPRKGVTHTLADVGDELLDVAITALGAYEHLTAHDGQALSRLAEKIMAVATRAGVAPERPADALREAGLLVKAEHGVLRDHARGLIEHTYAGLCPHEDDPDVRDPNCPVCAALNGVQALDLELQR
jgi:NTP pyrophosphatase (non-canonical NTP hydrolase)